VRLCTSAHLPTQIITAMDSLVRVARGAMPCAGASGLPRPSRSPWRTGRLGRLDPGGSRRRRGAFGLAGHPPFQRQSRSAARKSSTVSLPGTGIATRGVFGLLMQHQDSTQPRFVKTIPIDWFRAVKRGSKIPKTLALAVSNKVSKWPKNAAEYRENEIHLPPLANEAPEVAGETTIGVVTRLIDVVVGAIYDLLQIGMILDFFQNLFHVREITFEWDVVDIRSEHTFIFTLDEHLAGLGKDSLEMTRTEGEKAMIVPARRHLAAGLVKAQVRLLRDERIDLCLDFTTAVEDA
jgi:hypothetical protein